MVSLRRLALLAILAVLAAPAVAPAQPPLSFKYTDGAGRLAPPSPAAILLGNDCWWGPDCAAAVFNAGSFGVDYSANKPALPVVGASTFGGGTAMASWVLLTTIPANLSRAGVRISAAGGARIAWIEDDGTAAVGAARVNATLDFTDAGATAYTQGGKDLLDTARGRIEIYGPSGAFVAVRVY